MHKSCSCFLLKHKGMRLCFLLSETPPWFLPLTHQRWHLQILMLIMVSEDSKGFWCVAEFCWKNSSSIVDARRNIWCIGLFFHPNFEKHLYDHSAGWPGKREENRIRRRKREKEEGVASQSPLHVAWVFLHRAVWLSLFQKL